MKLAKETKLADQTVMSDLSRTVEQNLFIFRQIFIFSNPKESVKSQDPDFKKVAVSWIIKSAKGGQTDKAQPWGGASRRHKPP